MVMAMALDDSVSLFEFQMMLFLVEVMLLLYCIYLQFCTFSRHLYVLYLWLNVIIYLLIQKKNDHRMKFFLNVLHHDAISSMTSKYFLHISPIPLPIKEPLT
jgi:hypothetical protein